MKILTILLQFAGLITPELRAHLKDAFDAWEAKAKTTPSPLDDIAVAILRGILGV